MKLRAFWIAMALLIAGTLLPTSAQDEAEGRHAEKDRDSRVSEEEVYHLKKHLAELLETGQLDEAAEVKEQLARLTEQRGRHINREAGEQRRMAIRKEIENLHRQGHHEEAEHLERKHFDHPERDQEIREREMIPELHRRLHHLKVAIENLHLAGYREPAEHLEREAEQLIREIHRQEGPRHEPKGPFHPRGGVDEEAREAIRRLEHNLEEIHRTLEQVHRRMHALHEQEERER